LPGFWRDAAAALLSALAGHASLRTLSLAMNTLAAADGSVAGAALGALVKANAPALTQMDVALCSLGDTGLRSLFQALPANTHLCTLKVSFNGMSAIFARDVLLPAVRANTSLRKLSTSAEFPEGREAEALVAARAAAADAAQ
jgi:hypothetical protein